MVSGALTNIFNKNFKISLTLISIMGSKFIITHALTYLFRIVDHFLHTCYANLSLYKFDDLHHSGVMSSVFDY